MILQNFESVSRQTNFGWLVETPIVCVFVCVFFGVSVFGVLVGVYVLVLVDLYVLCFY